MASQSGESLLNTHDIPQKLQMGYASNIVLALELEILCTYLTKLKNKPQKDQADPPITSVDHCCTLREYGD